MFIRSVLTIAVLASFVFGAAAHAEGPSRNAPSLTAQIDGITSPGDIPAAASFGTPRSR